MEKVLLGVGAVSFIGYLIWLIVSIRNWDSKIPSIIGMLLSVVMILGGLSSSYNLEKILSWNWKVPQIFLKSSQSQADSDSESVSNETDEEDTIRRLRSSILALSSFYASDTSELDQAIADINFQYQALDEESKKQAKIYENLDSHIADSVVKSVNRLSKNLQPFTAEMILNKYGDKLSEKQKLSCLGDIGLYSCISDAKITLERINSDKVFDITSINVSCTESYKEGENLVEGTFEIYGVNNFGGPYRKTIYLAYSFNIDIQNCSVSGVNGFTY